ncbi:DEAD/DEAH box helicase [Anaerotignum sp.]|uniref:DEAD/DEAH box helicase n=1 Tax=Anaerotignum sp. TaxID=2039241 RepID=UPI00289950AE|nr:DEAD/DEAH box helicase family protein [Anaerotignum sp.]
MPSRNIDPWCKPCSFSKKNHFLLVTPLTRAGSVKTYTSVSWLLSQGVAQGYRIVWLVHRQELVEQTYQEFRKQAPVLRGTGINKIRILPVSGVHLKMSMVNKADIYVYSISSVANMHGYRFIERMIGAQGKRKLIVVVDEAYHAVAANYQKVIKKLTVLNPNRVLLGLAATPTRMQESEQKRLQEIFNINKNLLSNKVAIP